LQRAGRHVLHDDPRVGVRPEHVEDADHVHVVEPGDRARLAQRPLPHLLPLAGGQTGRRNQLFDGHVTVQDDIGRPPDATHPALTERRDEPVTVSDYGWGRRRHHAENTRSCPATANRSAECGTRVTGLASFMSYARSMDEEALVRVVRGTPTDGELAALVAIVAARSTSMDATPPRPSVSAWMMSARPPM